MENFDWAGIACPYCSCPMSIHSEMGVCVRCDTRCLDTESGFPEYAHVRIYKEIRKSESMSQHMWKGGCSACFTTTQYWSYGATLGTMLEHIRRCSRFRYALSLDPTRQSPVSSAQRLSSSSGRQRTGGIQVGPPWVPPLFTLPRGIGRDGEPVLPIVLPKGWAELTRKIQAPFGRCRVCDEPNTLTLRPGAAQFNTVCSIDRRHDR